MNICFKIPICLLRFLSALYYMGHIISSTLKEDFTFILTGFLFLYKVRFFSHFIEIGYFSSVTNEIFCCQLFNFLTKCLVWTAVVTKSYSLTEALAQKILLLSVCLYMWTQTNPFCCVTAFGQNHTAKVSTPVFRSINVSSWNRIFDGCRFTSSPHKIVQLIKCEIFNTALL